ncbi:MAG: NAD-dependent epimerase/dehydratase family protein [Planctomycetia bacterium]|nr:NAD-dependent epimerase/dehydratase family protein [Planctomycetia bacterium]
MITLVTGATGLVGNNAVRRLLENGSAVRVLAREAADPRPLAGLDVEVARGDVRDREAVTRAIRGSGCIVHAAAHVHIGWSGLAMARAVNVEGTRNIAAAAHAEGAKLVHVSSLDALGCATLEQAGDEGTEPVGGVRCPYVVTKREAEQVILDFVAHGLDARIVNPGFMVGPYDLKPSSGRMLLQVARGWGLGAPTGLNTYCDVRDVVSGILSAVRIGKPGRRYILGGEVLTYFQAWRIFADVTGGTPPMIPVGRLLRTAAGYCGDLWTKLTGYEPDVNSAATAISGQKRNFSSARATAELGYRPRPLRESATDAWNWFRQNGYV